LLINPSFANCRYSDPTDKLPARMTSQQTDEGKLQNQVSDQSKLNSIYTQSRVSGGQVNIKVPMVDDSARSIRFRPSQRWWWLHSSGIWRCVGYYIRKHQSWGGVSYFQI